MSMAMQVTIEVCADSVGVQSCIGGKQVVIEAKGVDVDELISEIGSGVILDTIGVEACMEYFGIE